MNRTAKHAKRRCTAMLQLNNGSGRYMRQMRPDSMFERTVPHRLCALLDAVLIGHWCPPLKDLAKGSESQAGLQLTGSFRGQHQPVEKFLHCGRWM